MPSKPGKAPAPTELESCVLAILGRLGPCTAYSVRGFLSVSQSSFWSASAGAIYPLLRRLAGLGWVASRDLPFGSRRRTLHRLTPAGRRRLRKWLSAPISEPALAHTFDPLRARVFFLDLVPAAERRAFLEGAVSGTAAVLAKHRDELAAGKRGFSEWERFGREGAIRELETRLDWLRRVKRRTAGEEAG